MLAELRVPEAPAAERVTGFVGLVIQPDAATIRKSYELASSSLRDGAEHMLAPGSLPHVTLTQCALREAPRERIVEFVGDLEAQLRGRTIPLRSVVAFAGAFVFWCVDEASPERSLLQRAHERAVGVAEGFLDPVANTRVVEGTMKLTPDDPTLVSNARTYGDAFVKDRYLPHITLGFDSRLAAGTSVPRQDFPHMMSVARIVLARLGSFGGVEAVLTLPPA